jgi:hypothetical protein
VSDRTIEAFIMWDAQPLPQFGDLVDASRPEGILAPFGGDARPSAYKL